MTGRMLRLEEYESISGRFAGLPPTGAEGHAYSARDFFALCRGEDIVSEIFFLHIYRHKKTSCGALSKKRNSEGSPREDKGAAC